MGHMCTEKDCSIFRGMLIACDDCDRMSEKSVRFAGGISMNAPKPPQMS